MRFPLQFGLTASAVALVAATLAPASSTVIRPIVRPQVQVHQMMRTPFTAARGMIIGRHAGFDVAAATKPAIYVSDYGSNVVYGYPSTGGSPTYTISSGISGPQGLDTTKSELYVANTNLSQILVYKPPSTAVKATITDTGYFPAGVAVNATGSQVWVSNICSAPSCGPGNLQEYDNKGKLLNTITCTNLNRYYFVDVDAKGNVAVDGQSSAGAPSIDVIPAGKKTCTAVTLTSLQFPGGVQWTKSGDLAIDDQTSMTITVLKAPSFTKIKSTTPLNGGVSDPVTFAFTKTNADVWTANAGSGNATEFKFPAGGSPILTITGLTQPIGVAVMPPDVPK